MNKFEEVISKFYHRLALVRTIVPIVTLFVQLVVLSIQLLIAFKLFGINPSIFFSELFH